MRPIAVSMNTRQINFVAFLIVSVALSVGYYIQYGLGFEPCLLCLTQRASLLALAAVFFLAFIHSPGLLLHKIYISVGLFFSLVGLLAAARQLYLEHLPASDEAVCLPNFSFFWQMGHYYDALKMFMTGGQECGKVVWTFAGLSLAAWSGLFLVGIFVFLLWQLVADNH